MSKLKYESFMIYATKDSTRIKTHHEHFTTRVQCLLNRIGNGQKSIKSTKTFVETKQQIWEEDVIVSKVFQVLSYNSKTLDKIRVMVIGR